MVEELQLRKGELGRHLGSTILDGVDESHVLFAIVLQQATTRTHRYCTIRGTPWHVQQWTGHPDTPLCMPSCSD